MTKLTTRTSTSTRLTDTQLIVLSRAAQREDGAANLPEGITDKAAQKLAATLVRRELVREIRAKPGMPVWRRSEEGRSQALIITKLGRTAIKAEDDRVLEDADSVVLGAASTDKAAAQLDQARKRYGMQSERSNRANSSNRQETPIRGGRQQGLELVADRSAAAVRGHDVVGDEIGRVGVGRDEIDLELHAVDARDVEPVDREGAGMVLGDRRVEGRFRPAEVLDQGAGRAEGHSHR